MDIHYTSPLEYWKQLQRCKNLESILAKIPDANQVAKLRAISKLTEEQVIQLSERCPRSIDLTLEVIQSVLDTA